MSQEKETLTIRLPKLGESIVSATVVQWFKKEGEAVEVDEPLLEVATDKVNSEIPSPSAGILSKILVQVDEDVEVGAPLAELSLKQGEPLSQQEAGPRTREESSLAPASGSTSAKKGFLSPAVLRMAQEAGVSLSELDKVKGRGEGGRVTRADLEAYLAKKSTPAAASSCQRKGGERIKMNPLRKAIAENVTRSFYTAPHAFLINKVDVTEVMASIAQKREAFLQEHGVKLTITPLLVRALTESLLQFPHLNASIEGEELFIHKQVNVGIAVAVGEAVVVPILRDCQHQSLHELAGQIRDLSTRARSEQLRPDEVREGTVTLTNFGMSGGLIGLPIIRHPEVAILGAGAIRKSVEVLEGDQMGIRQILHLTLSFDHRAVDGMYAAQFLHAVQERLEHVSLS